VVMRPESRSLEGERTQLENYLAARNNGGADNQTGGGSENSGSGGENSGNVAGGMLSGSRWLNIIPARCGMI
jgi:hypothetical protein